MINVSKNKINWVVIPEGAYLELVLRIVTSSACLKLEDLLHFSAWVKSNFFPSGSPFFDRNDFKPASLLTHSHSTVTKCDWIFFLYLLKNM